MSVPKVRLNLDLDDTLVRWDSNSSAGLSEPKINEDLVRAALAFQKEQAALGVEVEFCIATQRCCLVMQGRHGYGSPAFKNETLLGTPIFIKHLLERLRSQGLSIDSKRGVGSSMDVFYDKGIGSYYADVYSYGDPEAKIFNSYKLSLDLQMENDTPEVIAIKEEFETWKSLRSEQYIVEARTYLKNMGRISTDQVNTLGKEELIPKLTCNDYIQIKLISDLQRLADRDIMIVREWLQKKGILGAQTMSLEEIKKMFDDKNGLAQYVREQSSSGCLNIFVDDGVKENYSKYNNVPSVALVNPCLGEGTNKFKGKAELLTEFRIAATTQAVNTAFTLIDNVVLSDKKNFNSNWKNFIAFIRSPQARVLHRDIEQLKRVTDYCYEFSVPEASTVLAPSDWLLDAMQKNGFAKELEVLQCFYDSGDYEGTFAECKSNLLKRLDRQTYEVLGKSYGDIFLKAPVSRSELIKQSSELQEVVILASKAAKIQPSEEFSDAIIKANSALSNAQKATSIWRHPINFIQDRFPGLVNILASIKFPWTKTKDTAAPVSQLQPVVAPRVSGKNDSYITSAIKAAPEPVASALAALTPVIVPAPPAAPVPELVVGSSPAPAAKFDHTCNLTM